MLCSFVHSSGALGWHFSFKLLQKKPHLSSQGQSTFGLLESCFAVTSAIWNELGTKMAAASDWQMTTWVVAAACLLWRGISALCDIRALISRVVFWHAFSEGRRKTKERRENKRTIFTERRQVTAVGGGIFPCMGRFKTSAVVVNVGGTALPKRREGDHKKMLRD